MKYLVFQNVLKGKSEIIALYIYIYMIMQVLISEELCTLAALMTVAA